MFNHFPGQICLPMFRLCRLRAYDVSLFCYLVDISGILHIDLKSAMASEITIK